eukprot:scaffold259101_cov15-Tisochrysis_lutea.AAC.1
MSDSQGQAGHGLLICKTFYVRGLFQVLLAMKTGSKQQVCSVSLATDGITFRWEDDSKTLQCSVFLKSEVGGQDMEAGSVPLCIALLLCKRSSLTAARTGQ